MTKQELETLKELALVGADTQVITAARHWLPVLIADVERLQFIEMQDEATQRENKRLMARDALADRLTATVERLTRENEELRKGACAPIRVERTETL